jgi:hypothetical protein
VVTDTIQNLKCQSRNKYFKKKFQFIKKMMSITELIPNFHHPEIQALYQYGWDFPESKIEEILALPRQTLIEDLEKVIDDSMTRFAVYKEIEYNSNTHSFLTHAIWLLCELKAEESLPKVLDVLRQEDEWLEYWFSDLKHEMLPINFWHLGVNQSVKLFDFLREPNHYWSPRSIVSTALVHIGFYNEDKWDEIIVGFRDLIDFLIMHADDSSIADEEFIGGLVADIFDLNCSELLTDIKKLYDADLVALGIAGRWTDLQKDFFNPEFTKKPHFERKSMAEFYVEIRGIIAKNKEEDRQWAEGRAEREAKEAAQKEARAKARKAAERAEALRPQSKFSVMKQGIIKSPVSPTMNSKKMMQNKSTPRNALCTCGSGRKFKNCHGK